MTRRLAWGGVAGPVAFTGAWLAGGALRHGYRPAEDTISRLAEVGAPTRPLMTAGFVTFGVGLSLHGQALRAALPGRAWVGATGTGLATLAVAALPLGRSAGGDHLHAAAAGAAYLTLAATPLLAAGALRAAGRPPAARASVVAGTLCAALLAASLLGSATGAWQRAGLGVGHLWVVASGAWILGGGSVVAGRP